jgi:NAD(P)-dependent dehydrogenase (short-subunit alcohol dehydrogenase family)
MKEVFNTDLLENRHAVLTGSGSGITFEVARLFATHGARVTVVGRNSEKCIEAVNKITSAGGQAFAAPADVRNSEALSGAFESAVKANGKVDICVAGAAGNFVASAESMSSNAFRSVVDIDLVGTFNTFRGAYDRRSLNGLSLIAISAVQASMPTAMQAHVCAAKAGVEMLVRSLCIEWANLGVRINAIAPGPIADTVGMEKLAPNGDLSWQRLLEGIPMNRPGIKKEIADLALFLCSGASNYINGTVITIDGGQSNLGSFPFGQMLSSSMSK